MGHTGILITVTVITDDDLVKLVMAIFCTQLYQSINNVASRKRMQLLDIISISLP